MMVGIAIGIFCCVVTVNGVRDPESTVWSEQVHIWLSDCRRR